MLEHLPAGASYASCVQVVAAALQALANMCKLDDVRGRVQASAKVSVVPAGCVPSFS